jgi:hypothetical protein
MSGPHSRCADFAPITWAFTRGLAGLRLHRMRLTMKNHTIPTLLALAAATAVTRAGTPAPSPEIAAAKEAPWITPTLDVRLRYEFADIDGLDPAHALTLRERSGFKTRTWGGFSLVAEGEFTQALVDDYHGGAPGVDPFDPRNSVIADPDNEELN